ncbi:MAG TPA: signal recognition particle-docking protein FtsY [Firmicutes bacterium]|nr:signal recognition particle-docking protein FtsY [Bacillota bacterium]
MDQGKQQRTGIFSRLKEGLARTRDGLVGRINLLVGGRARLDQDTLDQIEEILIEADIGAVRASQLVEKLRDEVKRSGNGTRVNDIIKNDLLEILGQGNAEITRAEPGTPTVIMFVGVNGTGKTTTVAKLAFHYRTRGHKVMMAAADTFRAAAIQQLEAWGKKVGAMVVSHEEGGDPAAVAYDAVQAAKARGVDYLLVDTAGRLHTRVNLMEELKKIKRVIARDLPGAPHEVLLVIDATTGQNAISQAKVFSQEIGVTGIALTKLDGTAKGGIVVAIKDELGIPVKLVGIGEGPEDLKPFDPVMFVNALFE